jgi:hypothetical protein
VDRTAANAAGELLLVGTASPTVTRFARLSAGGTLVAGSVGPVTTPPLRDVALGPTGTVTWVSDAGSGTLVGQQTTPGGAAATATVTGLRSASVAVGSGAPVVVAGRALPTGDVVVESRDVVTGPALSGGQLIRGPYPARLDLAGDVAAIGSRTIIAGSFRSSAMTTSPTSNRLGLLVFNGAVTTTNLPPVGSVPRIINSLPQTIIVEGWIIDPDTTGPVVFRVYLDGDRKIEQEASSASPGSVASFPRHGDRHGYSELLDNVSVGNHTVCVTALDSTSGAETQADCVGTEAAPGQPQGNFDGAFSPSSGLIRAEGWALDPDIYDGSARVRVTVNGVVAGSVLANRPWAGGGNRAWLIDLAVGAGTHNVCATVVNVGYGSDLDLGCQTVSVSDGTPFGNFDAVDPVGPQQVRASGWVIDPDTTGPTAVLIFVDGVPKAFRWAAEPRPDIGLGFPAYGPNHGWSATFDSPPGLRNVCVLAGNIGPGRIAGIGCAAVNVPALPRAAVKGKVTRKVTRKVRAKSKKVARKVTKRR